MTNEQAEALGRRWIAADGEWREGMRAACFADWGTVTRVFTDDDETQTVYVSWDYDASSGDLRDYGADAWPDLRDAATRGAALDVVRKRWGDSTATTSHWAERWTVANGNGHAQEFRMADTEAEALVAALEAAPKERG